MTDALADLQLPAGEHVLWSGRPDPGKLFTRNDYFLVPFSLLWGGFAFFFFGTAISSGVPVMAGVFGLAFALMHGLQNALRLAAPKTQ